VGRSNRTNVNRPYFSFPNLLISFRYSTINDLAKLHSLLFRDNITAGSTQAQILDGQTIKEWLLPIWVTANSPEVVRISDVQQNSRQQNKINLDGLFGPAMGMLSPHWCRNNKQLLAQRKGTLFPFLMISLS